MASVKLPWDLEEEIISRLPPRYLLRFRSVCKQWNSVFNDQSFLENHMGRSRPQLIFLTESKSFSIGIDLGGGGGVDPKIEVCELASDFPNQTKNARITSITACDGLLFRHFWEKGVAIWNPWLRQVGWIEYEDKAFELCGVGYDSIGYKILGRFHCLRSDGDGCQRGYDRFAIYDCASQALKFIDSPLTRWSTRADPMSLNGNLFWIGYSGETRKHVIQSFDFSMVTFKEIFCLLPCEKMLTVNQLILAVFEGGRLSLLNRNYVTGKIEIWVTNNKVVVDKGEQVVWVNLMTFPTSNLPILINKLWGIMYFIFDKTLIMCWSEDETGDVCIYLVREDVFKKISMGSGSVLRYSHCVYVPNLIPVPLEFRSLQVY
ncbi:unnamed protein product [Microthlaspi erraticum]|uniref:F-box domain-containing protein n=1 Tax=Microthlaspi erraticum TaxID=1685480 RepID=A0A6D2KG68_9BRAS|nr:unnamed protein product [Microthlaspi erraticum]